MLWHSQRRYGLCAGIHRVDIDYMLKFTAQIWTPRWHSQSGHGLHAGIHSPDIDSALACTLAQRRYWLRTGIHSPECSLGSWTEYHLSLETICDNILVLKLFKASQGCTALYTVQYVSYIIHICTMYIVHVRKHICKVRFSSGKWLEYKNHPARK